jgi:hypothetical protein
VCRRGEAVEKDRKTATSNSTDPLASTARQLDAMDIYSIQGFLWKLKKGVTGSTWKKNWVYADNLMLLQYGGNSRPTANESPKYSWRIADCHIEPSHIRRFGFEVSTAAETIVFAADDMDSFLKWAKILGIRLPQVEAEESVPEQMESVQEEAEESKSDLGHLERSVQEFFRRNKFAKVRAPPLSLFLFLISLVV